MQNNNINYIIENINNNIFPDNNFNNYEIIDNKKKYNTIYINNNNINDIIDNKYISYLNYDKNNYNLLNSFLSIYDEKEIFDNIVLYDINIDKIYLNFNNHPINIFLHNIKCNKIISDIELKNNPLKENKIQYLYVKNCSINQINLKHINNDKFKYNIITNNLKKYYKYNNIFLDDIKLQINNNIIDKLTFKNIFLIY